MPERLNAGPMDLEWLAENLRLDEVLSEKLPLENLLQSLPSLSLQAWDWGVDVVSEGEKGEDIFVLYSGRLSVWRKGGRPEAGQLAALEPGDFFGEIGFLLKSARSATVRTESKCKLFRFPAREFSALLKHHDKLAAWVKQVAEKRIEKIFAGET